MKVDEYMNEIKTIDNYINSYPENIKDILTKIRRIIVENYPIVEEKISWNMPTFYWKENIIHFAVGKNHIGIYPSPSPIIYFENELKEYKTSKGAIQFPLNKPIPYKLIEKIVLFRINEIKNKFRNQLYTFKAKIKKVDGLDAAYIEIPFDIKKEFGVGEIKVTATFDNIKYNGSIVNMGVKNEDGSICYIIGITKEIRSKLKKEFGDTIKVTTKQRFD